MRSVRSAFGYRLHALLTQREHALQQRRQLLASALCQVARAEQQMAEAQQRVQLQRERLATVAARQVAGELRASDSVQLSQFARRLRGTLSELEAEVQRRQDEMARCESDVAASRDAVRAAEAALKAVQSHKDQWARVRHQQQARQDDEELAEVSTGLSVGGLLDEQVDVGDRNG